MLSERFRRACDRIWEASYNHPFVQELGRGTLDEEKFRFYLRQDYVYLIDFSRFFALAAAKSKSLEAMGRFAELLDQTLRLEMELHRSICSEFGISPEELARTHPAPTTLAYTSYLLRTAYEGTTEEMLAALLPCSWGYAEIGVRLKASGLPEAPHYAKWIETYASKEYLDLVAWLRRLFDESTADKGERERNRLFEAFETSSRWEYLFWEMAWRMESWPL